MTGFTGLRAVTFDGDQTLWDFDQVMRHSLGKALDELTRLASDAAGRLTVDSMIAVRQRVVAELKGSTTSLEEIRYQAFRRTLQETGHPDDDLAGHLNAVYLKHRFEDIELYDDVLPALTELGKKHRLGLLSNGNSYPERCGLDGVFRAVVFSQDHGIEKPDAGLFQITLEELGCAADETVHVGDSLEKDVTGAANAGIRSVWLNRHGVANNTGIEPDAEIASLSELVGMLP